ncbi:M56 family metallopeptidase [Cellulophaga sp. HaHa_2_95]|uniref:M56 family metallopeptidase n=1 Tax=Cellulophaga sp. HaHa_2_95 TaxID=2745558 RepID=UPI001C4F4922|nr:M56 family metallopeptidase [Cellulophaga sp. HaHa_2_95]QXP56162.1 M56 family metallopeptidase [Cellulophaga sp. HaHa_2_95]
MGLYLIKVTTCLAIFIVFYKLVLENESMHTFKRFYLISSLIAASLIPAILFTEYIYITPEPVLNIYVSEINSDEIPAFSQKTDYLTPTLWTIYGLGVLIFGCKFCSNLFKISICIRRNPKINYDRSIHVLLEERLSPHTFFNFIFLNKQKFEAHEIPEEVLLHEQAHAVQKHSLDVLFIELMQVILWFNPFIYFFKMAIKLNHEFLADQAVLQKGAELSNYQKILLAFSSNATETQLANAINYSSIKKRFTIMKKTTSKKAIWLRSLLVLPLLTLVLYGFSETQIKQINITKDSVEIKSQEKNESHKRHLIVPTAPTEKNLNEWKNGNKFSIWINGASVNNSQLEKYKASDFYHYISRFIYDNARSKHYPQPYHVHVYTKSAFNEQFTTNDREINILINKDGQFLIQNELVSAPDLKRHLYMLNTDLSKEEKSNQVSALIHISPNAPRQAVNNVATILEEYGCATIDIVEKKEQQDGATKTQLTAYNKLARKYNGMDASTMRIKKGEVDRMEYLYSIMTDKQKKSAEAFPELPPLPEPPMPPSTQRVGKGEVSAIPAPPTPPKTPKSPLDHVLEMAKKDANFYYEGKSITSDEAIDLIKNNNNLNIDTRNTGSKNPTVKITKEPIVIKN